jgi:hypothetical protein
LYNFVANDGWSWLSSPFPSVMAPWCHQSENDVASTDPGHDTPANLLAAPHATKIKTAKNSTTQKKV